MTIRYNAALALMLATIAATPGRSATQTEEFEAALRRATPAATAPSASVGALRPRPAASPTRYVGVAPGEPALAKRGTIPEKWRNLTAITDQVWFDLNDDIAAGKLDGVALLERVTQPLPLPAGALLVECNRQSMQFDYTMNADLSPSLSRRLAEARQTSTAELQEEAEREAAPMVQALGEFFLQRGFRPFRSGIVPSTSFYNEKTRLRVDVMNTSVDDVDSSCARYGMKVPDGPFLRFSNYPIERGENFIPASDLKKPYRDRQKSPVGKVDPFG